MKQIITLIILLALPALAISQKEVKIKLNGIDQVTASKMMAHGDKVSWYTMSNSDKIANNISVELTNVGEKKKDRGRASVQAEPDANGMYSFNAEVDVDLKKIDAAKPIHIEVVIETIFGNEVFYSKDVSFADLNKPIVLNGYMWRASNDKIAPEKDLCLEFSSYLSNQDIRKQFTDNEDFYKFKRSDFELYLKQDNTAEWKKFDGPFEGGFANNNAVNLTNPLPSWINPEKELFVRFAAKTPLGNYVWGEYSVKPHEYRKEHRATHYSSVAFDPNAKPKPKNLAATEQQEKEVEIIEPEPVKQLEKSEQKASSTDAKQKLVQKSSPVEKKKSGGLMKNAYDETIAAADSLFEAGSFTDAKTKYDEALKLKPEEKYPKEKSDECLAKIKAIKSKGSSMKGGMK